MPELQTDTDQYGDTTLYRRLVSNLVVLVLVVGGLIAAALLWGSYQSIDEVTNTSIDQAMERTRAELGSFFEPVERNIEILRDRGEAGELSFELDDLEAFNRRLKPIIERHDQISAVAIGDATGRQYIYRRRGAHWIGLHLEGDEADETSWIRWDDEGREVDRWTEPVQSHERRRPWYEGAMDVGDDQTFWTDPFTFRTIDEPGMSAARRYQPPGGEPTVVALGMSLAEVSDFTTQMEPSENGYSAVMTASGKMVGLPSFSRYQDSSVVRDEVLSTWDQLGFDVLGAGFEKWRGESMDDGRIVEVDGDDRGTTRVGFSRFQLGDHQLVVSTVIPREDLTETIERQGYVAAGVGLVGLVMAVLLSTWWSRNYRQRMESVYEQARQFGKYELTDKLGAGGMGEVYRAEHAILERPTAIKLLKPEMYNRQSVRRFEREVQLTCRLTHPNTITIFDYGRTEEGLFYYAMELIDGVCLGEFLDYTGPLDDGRVVFLADQICGALAEAHESGLIHRDVKPTNVMIGDQGGIGDRITVMDFGLVKDVQAPDDSRLSSGDSRKGTPGYMAPEVIDGDAKPGPKLDIYALGAVMFTMVTGRRPFEGDSAVETMMAQLQVFPDPPSDIIDRSVDEELEALIMDCLARDPQQRPDSIREVRQVLEGCDSAGRWTVDDARRWWNDHGEDLVAIRDSVETFEGPRAFGLTVTMDGDDVSTTLDGDPGELFGRD